MCCSIGKTVPASNIRYKCGDPREKVMFEDVDVKFQAQMCLKFDADVFKNAFFPRIVTILIERLIPYRNMVTSFSQMSRVLNLVLVRVRVNNTAHSTEKAVLSTLPIASKHPLSIQCCSDIASDVVTTLVQRPKCWSDLLKVDTSLTAGRVLQRRRGQISGTNTPEI